MRRIFALIFFIALCAAATPTHAQRDTIAPPVGGVYQAYYEDDYSDRMTYFLHFKNVCFERFSTLNPDLNYDYIPYGTPIWMPKDEPCYDYQEGEFYGTWSQGYPARLKYYENGTWLDKPYYSKNVLYVGGKTSQDIADYLNICINDLLLENYILTYYPPRYAGARSADVFISDDAQACDENRPVLEPPSLPEGLNVLEIPKDKATPLYLVHEYNICREEISTYQPLNVYESYASSESETVTVYIPENFRPCYNENGQRLRYFGDDGRRLKQPEYTDLQVYVVHPGDTLDEIVYNFDICLVDLLWLNNFPELPTQVEIELFIPPSRFCDDDITYQQMPGLEHSGSKSLNDLPSIAIAYDICLEELEAWNPHLIPDPDGYWISRQIYKQNHTPIWVLIPNQTSPCYQTIEKPQEKLIYDIEREINICAEALLRNNQWDNLYYYRRDTLPCYNADGQRLIYPSALFENRYYQESYRPFLRNNGSELTYSPLPIHIFQQSEWLIDISRQYNVCMDDLIKINPVIRSIGYPVFLPQTRPCYDEITGLPLIYTDSDSKSPVIGEQLIYYGVVSWWRLPYYYNVCINRIYDANRAKLDQETSYLGLIIPTDRPPCYDGDGSQIEYACYAKNGIDAACFEDYSPENFTIHTLSRGESLASVANHYGIETWQLARANHLDPSIPIWVGQTLVVPKQGYGAQFYALMLGGGVLILLTIGLILPLARRQNQAG